MKECKREYFINGVDSQKRADIVFHIKRVDNKKLEKLSQKQLYDIVDFLNECQDTLTTIKHGVMNLYEKENF